MKKIAAALLLLGCCQMLGDLLRILPLKGFGAFTLLSPAPRVFCAVQGLETFSTRFSSIGMTVRVNPIRWN